MKRAGAVLDAAVILGRMALGGAFLWAGIAKAERPEAFSSLTEWLTASAGMPDDVVRGLAMVLPRGEVLLGACLILGLYARTALWCSLVLLLVFGAGIAAALFAGTPLGECGCFGGGRMGGPAVWIARNALLAAVACGLLRRRSQPIALDGLLGNGRRASEDS